VCEEHGFIMHYASRRLAERFGADPAVWCDLCGEIVRYGQVQEVDK